MTESEDAGAAYAQPAKWEPTTPRFSLLRMLVSWLVAAIAVLVASWIVPDVELKGADSAIVVAAVLGIANAILPPIVAAMRLPFTLALGFILVLLIDAGALVLAADLLPDLIRVDSFGDALMASIVIAAVMIVLTVIFGTNDDDEFTLRVTRRVVRRQGQQIRTSEPGLIMLEIDGLALPVLQLAMRSGSAPNLARWLADEGYDLTEWETDLSSQTGASQAGILLGSNEGIPAFRWVEKESGRLMSCSAPDDCAEIERRLASGRGILTQGGASRGNLLSGEADEAILTVSRIEADKRANPGYRAFFANGFNVTRALVLFIWEVVLELVASARAIRRDVEPGAIAGASTRCSAASSA